LGFQLGLNLIFSLKKVPIYWQPLGGFTLVGNYLGFFFLLIFLTNSYWITFQKLLGKIGEAGYWKFLRGCGFGRARSSPYIFGIFLKNIGLPGKINFSKLFKGIWFPPRGGLDFKLI